jgi:hypothetical protein
MLGITEQRRVPGAAGAEVDWRDRPRMVPTLRSSRGVEVDGFGLLLSRTLNVDQHSPTLGYRSQAVQSNERQCIDCKEFSEHFRERGAWAYSASGRMKEAAR